MPALSASQLEDIELMSYQLAQQAVEHYRQWKAGEVKIGKFALRAMARRYMTLRELRTLKPLEVWEFGRLFAFFALVYPNGDDDTPAGLAIDFCNLMYARENESI